MINSVLRRGALLTIAAAGLAAFALPSLAQTSFTEANKSIARLGAQGTGYYVAFVEPFGQNCQWGNVYVASDRKGIYAQLLAAKLSGKRISRLDYSQPSGNGTQCNADLVEISD